MDFESLLLLALATLAISPASKAEDEKWKWKDNSRNSRYLARETDQINKRYEVQEDERAFLQSYRPGRPNVGGNFIPNRPTNGLFAPSERPGGVYGQNGGVYGQNGGGYGQFGNDRYPGVLTGPVPSWDRDNVYVDFDRCKCTEKFNCNTPGFSYGHCDVGKQYCCYNSQANAGAGAQPLPNRPMHSIENGILVGPGGPVDYPPPGRPSPRPYPHQPLRPAFNRPLETGILIGPGGPHGSVSRPGHYAYRPAAGLGAYARSTSKEDDQK